MSGRIMYGGHHLPWRILMAGLLALGAAHAVAAVPGGIGPQGFMLAQEPAPVPDLQFRNGEGQFLTLEDFRGKVVLLNIWATWCVPCREEMPTLDAVQRELGGSDFEVLALSIDNAGIDVVKNFYQEIGIEHLRQYIDPKARVAPKLAVVGIPTTLLIDRQGREIGRLVGATEWDSPAMMQFFRETIERTGVR